LRTRCIRAGPRANLYFKPSEVKAAVVTCGGLCPGLNDVIRQIVITLESGYGVQDIVGIPYGYRGFFEPGLEARDAS
jgi:6-phosphofructokinase 1